MSDATFGRIIFPWGFAGNHVRWLLFLDQQIPNPFGENNIDSKLSFIKESVYDNNRRWDNWLSYEWNFREKLNPYIELAHPFRGWEYTQDVKELYLTVDDSEVPFKHYFHINISLNNNTPMAIRRKTASWVDQREYIFEQIGKFPNKKIINCDTLFRPMLDYDFYKEIVDFYNFDDNYEVAQKVHDVYNQNRINSGKSFYEFFTSDTFKSILSDFQKYGEITNSNIEELK